MPEFGFNLQETVVLGNPLAAASRSGLDLPAPHGHRKIGEEGIFVSWVMDGKRSLESLLLKLSADIQLPLFTS